MSHKKIEKAINKWFEDTQKLITEVLPRDKSNSLLLCVITLPVMKTYCSAVAFLLNEGFKLPAMALIRVISEFFIKFLWCIYQDDENEIRNRLLSWEKTAGSKKLNLYKDLLDLKEGVLDKEELKKIEKSKIKLEISVNGNTAKKMPHVTSKGGLFESTSEIFGDNVSAILYSQFCSAVHIDPYILSGLRQEYAGQDLVINDGINENLVNLKMRCLNFAFMFLLTVHTKKHWRINAIEKEYKSIIGDLSNKD